MKLVVVAAKQPRNATQAKTWRNKVKQGGRTSVPVDGSPAIERSNALKAMELDESRATVGDGEREWRGCGGCCDVEGGRRGTLRWWLKGSDSSQGLESNVEEMGARALIPAPRPTVGAAVKIGGDGAEHAIVAACKLQSAIDSLHVNVERFLRCCAASSGSRVLHSSEGKLSRAQAHQHGNCASGSAHSNGTCLNCNSR